MTYLDNKNIYSTGTFYSNCRHGSIIFKNDNTDHFVYSEQLRGMYHGKVTKYTKNGDSYNFTYENGAMTSRTDITKT